MSKRKLMHGEEYIRGHADFSRVQALKTDRSESPYNWRIDLSPFKSEEDRGMKAGIRYLRNLG